MDTIYSLTCTHTKEGSKHFIEMEQKQEPIKSNQLDELPVKMLQSTPIPNLIPLEIVEINFNVALHYDVSSKQSLSAYLEDNNLSDKQFYNLLNKIASILNDSKNYMLNENHYIIHEDFIFVGESIDDLYLLYLPLKEVDQKESMNKELREFLMNTVSMVNNLSGNGLQQMVKVLNSSDFTIDKLLMTLQSLATQEAVQAEPATHVEEPIKRKEQQAPATAPKKEKRKSAKQPVSPLSPEPKPEPVPEPEPVETVVEGKVSERTKLVTILGVIFASALIWKLYLDNASEGMLFISLGLTILAIDIGFILLMIVKPGSVSSTPATKKTKTKEKRVPKQKSKKAKVMDAQPKDLDREEEAPPVEQSPIKPKDYYNNLGNETTVFSESPAEPEEAGLTTVLTEEQAYVELKQNEQSKKEYITDGDFKVGRSPNTVALVVEAVGVSREHFVITKVAGDYGIKDLHSSNGTKLNGEKLIPDKLYPLKDGDQIQFGKAECTFKMEA